MTVEIANTDNTATFQYWLNRTNEMAEAFRTKVVTVETEATSGNLSLNGTIELTDMFVYGNLGGGNISSNAVLTVISNVYVTSTDGTTREVTVGTAAVNATMNSSSFMTGNSTVNAVLYSTYLKIENETVQSNLTPSSLKLGNSIINTVVNSSSIALSNTLYDADITTISISVGNTVSYAVANLTNIKIANTLASATITPDDVRAGNSIANVVANSTVVKISNTSLTGDFFPDSIKVGNSIVNTEASISHIKIQNATSNVTITQSLISGRANAELNIINAASVTTTTGVYPTSSSVGNALGETSRRWALNATTINASGLITGTAGATITGMTNTSVSFNAGANVTANTTALKVGNSIVNTVITSDSITGSPNAQFNIVTTTGNVVSAGLFVYGANVHIGNNSVNADATLRVDGTANVTGDIFVGGDLTVTGNLEFLTPVSAQANLNPSSNGGLGGGFWLGQSDAQWNMSANSIIVYGTSGLLPDSNTIQLGSSTKRWVLNANTINATGLITGNSGASISGTANASVAFNVGANVTANTTALKVGNTISNVVANSTTISVAGTTSNIKITSSSIFVNDAKTQQELEVLSTTSGTTTQVIDSFSKTLYRSAEYTLSISDVASNSYQISKAIAIHATNIADINEYGVIYTNSQLGVFTASTNTTSVIVSFTPTVASTTITGSKKLYTI